MKLKIEYIDPRLLVAYENNSRVHSADQIDRIKRSIEEFGFINPVIIDESNTIVAGHARVESAVDLGLSEVPTISVEHLTEEQIKAYVIADNRLAELSSWNDDILTEELKWLDEQDFDITITGFDDISFDVDDVLNEEDDFEVVEPEEPVSKPGDVWLLGEHRVMCGDSTSFDDVDKLMQGSKADMCFTDPPYLMDFTGGVNADGSKSSVNSSHGRIANDKMSKSDGEEFIASVCHMIKSYVEGAFYISFYRLGMEYIFKGLESSGLKYRAVICWYKAGGTLSNSDYKSNYEPIFYGWVDKHNWYGGKAEWDVWDISKTKSNDLHPTMKPVPLVERAVSNSSKRNDVVIDLFGGSGTTLIACENLGRKARLMELDPKYVDVIVDRWQKHTEKEAILESTGETYNELKGDQDD